MKLKHNMYKKVVLKVQICCSHTYAMSVQSYMVFVFQLTTSMYDTQIYTLITLHFHFLLLVAKFYEQNNQITTHL